MTTRVFDRDFISIFVSAACEGRRHTTIKSASAFFLRVKIGHFHRTIRNKGDAFAVFSAGIFPYPTVRVVQYLTCGYEILPAPFVYRDGNNPLNKINEMKTAKFFMAFIAAALLASCSDDKDYSGDFGQIKVPDTRQLEQTVSADDTQSARGVTFTTERAWTSTIAETRAEAPAWISISPDRGDAAGSYTLKITLEPNTSGASRTATIVITCGTSKIEITVTQEGADDPIESTPANRIMRIDSRQQTIRNSGDSDPERWTSTSRFTYDDAGRLTCYEWDDSPENSADAMDEVLRISYPDAKTLKLSAETTESSEKESYTVTLDDAGRAVANSDDVRSQMVSTASSSKPYCLKYPAQGSKSYEDANIPVFRLSELYLNAAEAAIKRNDIPNTRKYLKPIYARTGKDLDAVADEGINLDLVLEQRRIEFWGEGQRFFDLLRNNKKVIREDYLSEVPNEAVEFDWSYYKIVLPVPNHEMEYNENMVQNPEYELH